VELMRRVRRNVDGVAGTHEGLLATERSFHFTVKHNEGLFKVMTVRWGAAPWQDVHVNDAEATGSVFAGDRNGVGIAYKADVEQALIRIWACSCKRAGPIVGRERRVLWGGLGHDGSPI
jgi:hypothetical protein